jgi:hypothetical protein
MTGQEKGDLLIQVTVWTGLTEHVLYITPITLTFFLQGPAGFPKKKFQGPS